MKHYLRKFLNVSILIVGLMGNIPMASAIDIPKDFEAYVEEKPSKYGDFDLEIYGVHLTVILPGIGSRNLNIPLILDQLLSFPTLSGGERVYLVEELPDTKLGSSVYTLAIQGSDETYYGHGRSLFVKPEDRGITETKRMVVVAAGNAFKLDNGPVLYSINGDSGDLITYGTLLEFISEKQIFSSPGYSLYTFETESGEQLTATALSIRDYWEPTPESLANAPTVTQVSETYHNGFGTWYKQINLSDREKFVIEIKDVRNQSIPFSIGNRIIKLSSDVRVNYDSRVMYRVDFNAPPTWYWYREIKYLNGPEGSLY